MAENKLVDLLADSYDCTYHAKRITLFKKYLLLARIIRGKEVNISATLFWFLNLYKVASKFLFYYMFLQIYFIWILFKL